MSLSLTSVRTLYSSVIDGVISGVREYFQDEGVDEQVLMELKHIWETRLKATKAVEAKNDKEVHPPVLKPNQAKTALTNHLTHQTTPVPIEIPANKNVAIQITLPAQQNVPDAQPRIITIQVPSTALTGNQLTNALSGPIIAATLALPQHLAQSLLQQHVTTVLNQQSGSVIQLQTQHLVQQPENTQGFNQQAGGVVRQIDGHNDTSDEEEEENEEEDDNVDDDDDDDADIKDDEENDENEGGAEEEPLNSEDDVSEEDPTELFDTENVVVCQYDKITRTRNKWKFYLKDGIMNLGGKDYVFQKSNGDAEW